MSTDRAVDLRFGRFDYLPRCHFFSVGKFVKFCFFFEFPGPHPKTDVFLPTMYFPFPFIFQTISQIA